MCTFCASVEKEGREKGEKRKAQKRVDMPHSATRLGRPGKVGRTVRGIEDL